MTLARRIGAGLATWPNRRGWMRALALAALGLPLALGIAWVVGLVGWRPVPPGTALPVAATLLLFPALGEELLFRAALLPRPGEPTTPFDRIWPVAALVLWHPLQARTFGPPWAGMFIQPGFLATVAVLGALLAAVYRTTGSVWPCVVVHWLAVAAWKLLFDGPF